MNDDYYQVLKVDKNASDSAIKKSYYKLARENHPDKFPENEREEATKSFQKIGEAYEVLSDPEKRKIYDAVGKEGLKSQGQGNVNPFDLFRSMFGNNFGGNNFGGNNFGGNNFGSNNFGSNNFGGFNFGFSNQNSERKISKNRDTVFPINISLKDAYTGKIKKLKITKKIIVNNSTKEHITHNLEKTWEKCSTCSGQGIVNEMRQVGPGMITQTQKHCSSCLGKGFDLLKEYSIEEVSEIIEINIPKGVNNNHQIRLENQGNVIPGTFPGDLLIVISVPNVENGFRRNGNDLYYEVKILLSEALCGSSIKIKTLDERDLYISFTSAIPEEHKILKNEGINSGNLIIVFDVIFPSSLSKERKREIKKVLPRPQNKIQRDKTDICYSI